MLSGVTVLVVDDEPAALEITQLMLVLYHARVVVASSGFQGLEQVHRRKPDVIISDISMPGMDGYQFIREVRNLPEHGSGKTPAIALTALSEDHEKTIRAGFQRHLPKPVELHALIETTASLAMYSHQAASRSFYP